MPKPKGGRGYRAPYDTHQIRVPDPIALQVHSLIERYQDYIERGGDPKHPVALLDQGKAVDKFQQEISSLRFDKAELLDRLHSDQKFIKSEARKKAKAINILKSSLGMKANAGGAIKREIEKALKLLSSTGSSS